MICSRCQSENPSDSAFCDGCGARLETACPNCGEPNRQGAKFCKRCGQSFDLSGVLAPKIERVSSLSEVHLPRHLAEKIIASRHAMEGERKQVTVLFADIR